MVKNGQPRPTPQRAQPIRSVAYRSPQDGPLGVEVMSFARLRALGPASRRAAPQRPEFHVLAMVRGGCGHHTVDFTRHPLGPGSVFWIRPGLVHQLDGVEELTGQLVLFQPDFLSPGTLAHTAAEDVFGPVCWTPGRPRLAERALDHLGAEFTDGADAPAGARAEVLRQLLAVLVTRLLPVDDRAGLPTTDTVFARFRAAVERDFVRLRQVSDYARALGYAPRTLARVTLAATGIGAKEFIDRRVALEAKRLLVHGELPAARCAARLGFDDAANFTKFFRRCTGMTPGEFRAAARPRGPGGSR
ncbi:helix-turn-helix domain-containing protein [Streptomyces sp. NPDC050485]|uniref:helix-turn-helix domain-containing protein n=1 Tax=Streptomyces sp. NPDC050485 TaxID=3365617 RepID=UPI00378EE05D